MAFNLDAEAGSSDWSRNRVASLPGLLVPLSAPGLPQLRRGDVGPGRGRCADRARWPALALSVGERSKRGRSPYSTAMSVASGAWACKARFLTEPGESAGVLEAEEAFELAVVAQRTPGPAQHVDTRRPSPPDRPSDSRRTPAAARGPSARAGCTTRSAPTAVRRRPPRGTRPRCPAPRRRGPRRASRAQEDRSGQGRRWR